MGPSNGGPINLKSARLQDAVFPFAILSAAKLEAVDMSGADLVHARFDHANLSAANLSCARLDYADLSEANLTNVNLRGASLRFATLSTANLEAAQLSGADLAYARFDHANLCAADLSGARLDYADFDGADLRKTNLRGASLQHAKNLTREQFEESRGSASTILPPHLQEPVSRSVAKRQTTAAEPCDPRPRPQVTTKLDVPKGDSYTQSIWIARALLLGALVTLGFAWKHLDEALPVPTPIAQIGSERPLPELRSRLDTGKRGLLPSVPEAPIEENATTERSISPRTEMAGSAERIVEAFGPNELSSRGPEEGREHSNKASEPLPLVSAESPLDASLQDAAPELRIEAVLALSQQVTVRAPELLDRVSELSSLALVAPPPTLLRAATVAISALRTEAPGASPLVAEASPLSMSLHATVPNTRVEVLKASPLISAVAPASISRLDIEPSLLSEAAQLLTPAFVVSAEPLAPSSFEASVLRDTLPPPVVVPPRPVFAVAVAPTEFKRSREESAEKTTGPNREPFMLVVSLSDQKIDVYQGTTRLTSSKVSSGMPGYATKAGVFSILEKQRYHHSNIYDGAPMPWMQRLTRSGTALHAGVVPGYPASHGCIRLPFSFAPKLFQMTSVGENVVVARDRLVPKLIEHPNLFQPLPLRATAKGEQASGRQLSASGRQLSEVPDVPAENAVPHLTLANQGSAETGTSGDQATTHDSSSGYNSRAVISQAVIDRSMPLRILVTRRTQRDRIIAVQYILSSLGYLAPQNFSGKVGTATADAIKAFQNANGMPENGIFSDDVAKKVYKVAGIEEPPEGHLFVRQDFSRLFDVPITFHNPELNSWHPCVYGHAIRP